MPFSVNIIMSSGFHKIHLGQLNSSNIKEIKRKKKKIGAIPKFIGLGLLVLICGFLIFALAVFIPGRNLYSSAQKTTVIAKEAYSFLKNQDLEASRSKLKELEENLLETQRQSTKLSWLKFIPLVGNYQKDMEHMLKGSIAGVQAIEIAVDTVNPYADLLGLKGKSTFVAGSADERIKMAVETLDKITPNIDKIADKIAVCEEELNQIDPERYPEKIGSLTIRSRLKSAKQLFSQTAELFIEAQPFLKEVPALFGVKEPKRYLILFQNDAELRATGGFITAYAVFKIDKGKMQVEKADDIYKLDEAKKKKYPAPSVILKYHKDVNTLNLRDNNLSPDFYISMTDFEKMLTESVSGFPSFDGIIAVDTHVLVSAIKILGDFNVYGRTFSAEIDKRCDCPKAVYELEDYSTKPVAYVREDRKDIIGVLLYQIMQRALGVSPSKYWGKLFQTFLEEAQQKHVLLYFHDQNAQKGIESLNFGGRILPFEGDYLHINDVNFAGAKSNLFVKHTVKQNIEIEEDGSIIKTLILNYKNPAPFSNCNLEAGQLCLNGILRNWLRIYVPQGSKLIEFTGSEKETVTYEELGKTVFEGFMTVKPQGATEVRIKYKLPNKVNKGSLYKMLIQKQPGTDGYEYVVSYKNREIEKFTLQIDKEISFKL